MDPIKLGVVAVMVSLCGVEATLVIGPAGIVMMHMPPIMAWVTWFIPPGVYLAGAGAAWEFRSRAELYRGVRQGLNGMSACLGVAAFCSSTTLDPGLYQAAFARALAAATGLVVVAITFTSQRRPECASAAE